MSEERGGLTPGKAIFMGVSGGVAVVGCLIALPFLVAIVGILAAIAIPNFVVMQYRAKRAEVPANVDGIKTALLAYDAAFDDFVEVREAVPRPEYMLDGQQVEWPSGTPFDTLGWAPDGPVRGTYWVEVRDNGMDFVVHGKINVDGDSNYAWYTATKSINTTFNSYNDDY